MPELVADPPSLSCCHLFSEPGIKTSQRLDPDLFCLARDATGRSASCPSGRPRGSDISPGDSLRDNLNGNVAADLLQIAQWEIFYTNYGCRVGPLSDPTLRLAGRLTGR
jgi:hypothetical protein